ncbi:MAG: PQQ-like beta-propeller repeat protein [Clostridiales bacterium]|nr:PQQ-like beta-propeller repeat protein [Clostridiales bacterium]
MILKSRKISKTTILQGEAVKLILPQNINQDSFSKLSQSIKSFSGSFEILSNPEKKAITEASGPVILVGNLADNSCVEHLYYQFLCATDKWYPGPDGYEVRTLIDPFGTGFNIIHVGYSDQAGLKTAINVLASEVAESIPHMKTIKPSRLHIPDEYAIFIAKDVLDAQKDTFFYSIRPENKGYMAYLTGNEEVLSDYIEAMEYILDAEKQHLMFYNRYTVWRLLEVTGMIDGRVMEESPLFFLDWMRSNEGIGSIDKHQYQSLTIARNNHGTIPALGIKMFCGYLKTYHPDVHDIDKFEELADNVYAPYFNGSWKPQCDGLCHGWWLSQPVLLHYGLADPDKKYFVYGGAKRAAECALAVINNKGYLTAAGDTLMNRQHPGFSLRIAAAYYKDGRYKYANDILPFDYANCGEQSAMFRQFDIGLEPVQPNAGTTIVPIDKLIYNTWDNEDEDYSKTISDTAPQAPIEKCFDKISFRAGWNENDNFMLIDGLGGGGHSYSDAGAILEYSAFGVPFLVSEDRLTYVEPENHNLITICRDGIREDIPAFPILEDFNEFDDGISYVRFLSKNNNGANWVREIYFIPGVGAAVRDYVEAVKSGEFSIEAHFRTPGSIIPKEDGYLSMRKSDTGGNIAFILTALNDEDTNISFTKQNYSHLFRTPPGKELLEFEGLDNKKLFKNRYKVSKLEITEYKAKRNLKLEKGDSIVFTHFMSAGKDDERPVLVKETDEGIMIEKDDYYKVLSFEKKHVEREVFYNDEEPAFDFFADLSYEGNDVFTTITKTDNGYAVGNGAGEISVLDQDCELLWTVKEEDTVNTVCMGNGFLYAGIGHNTIVAYRNGVKIWKRKFDRIPTMYYWWEYGTQRAVSIKAFNDLVLVGCGDDHLRCWDIDGNEKWTYYYRAAVPYKFDVMDIDGDGNDEIIISGGALSAYSQIEIIDLSGQLKYRANDFAGAGWTSFTSAICVFEKYGDKYILQGVNRNENFVLKKYTGEEKSHFETIFSYKLAGAVSALLEDNGTIYAGTSLGFLSAYDMQGNRKWLTSLNGGVRHIAKTPNGLLVMELDGTMYRLSNSGKIQTLSMDSIIARNIIENEDKLVMIQGNGIYHVMREPVNEEF